MMDVLCLYPGTGSQPDYFSSLNAVDDNLT